jgi:hypothetical protein
MDHSRGGPYVPQQLGCDESLNHHRTCRTALLALGSRSFLL